MIMNEGVELYFKAVTANLFTVLGLLVESSTPIEIPMGYLEVYISIRKNSLTVTSSSPVFPPYLPSSLF